MDALGWVGLGVAIGGAVVLGFFVWLLREMGRYSPWR